jgi:two-component system, LytTR family, response regulator
MMISSVIVDDEPANIRILKKMLADFCPNVQVIAEAKDVRQGVDIIRQTKPSLVFLDIEMPYGNAFDLLDKLMPVEFEIIFITAFNEYALKAFRYSALDYLLKPVSIQELKGAVEKAFQRIDLKITNAQLKNLLENLKKEKEGLQQVALPAKDGFIFVPTDDILRCEASGAYTHVFTRNNGEILSSKSIGEYEEMLPENIFFRVHHSHLINLYEIKKYHRGRGGYVEMKDGMLIDVAVRRKDEFLAKLSL